MSMRDEFENRNKVPVGAIWNSRKRGYYYSSSPSVAHSFNDLWESFLDGWQAARAQGEPVAWLIYDDNGNPLPPTTSEEIADLSAARSGRDSVPLYTHPPSGANQGGAPDDWTNEQYTKIQDFVISRGLYKGQPDDKSHADIVLELAEQAARAQVNGEWGSEAARCRHFWVSHSHSKGLECVSCGMEAPESTYTETSPNRPDIAFFGAEPEPEWARVAELEAEIVKTKEVCAESLKRVIACWREDGVSGEHKNIADSFDQFLSGLPETSAWLLRTQAEAVKDSIDYCEQVQYGQCPPAIEVKTLLSHAQRLRNQADEAEKGGK